MDVGSKTSRFVQLVHSRNSARVILCGSLLLTLLAWHLTNLHVAQGHREKFAFRVSQIEDRITERMVEYEQVLRGGVGLFQASDEVTRSDWKNYVEHCGLPRYFPGIQAMGFAVALPPHQVEDHVAQVRAEGFSEYRLSPATDRQDYTAIVFIEPFDWRNRRAFGYDMYSDAIRRKAMDKAAESGLPAISGKITLVQETDADVQSGMLCYLPVYRSGADLDTPAQRKLALRGWVYGAFRCDDLMRGTIDASVADVKFSIYDGSDLFETNLLFHSEDRPDAGRIEMTEELFAQVPLTLSGHDWTLQIAAKSAFFEGRESLLSLLVAFSGLTVDLLLFAVISTLGRQRERALFIANQMTKDLRESELEMRTILENASEAILSVSECGIVLAANEAAHRVFRSGNSLTHSQIDERLLTARFQDLLERADDTANGGSGFTVQCRRLDGSRFPCRMSIGQVSVHNKVSYTIIARDETVRMESEKQLADTNRQLIESSRKAGIAEVATGVLHNVGNVLNSVTTSSGVIAEILDQSSVSQLAAGAEILNQHKADLTKFLTTDPRGLHFSDFVDQVSAALTKDRMRLTEENSRLREHIQHIREVIRAQQEEARATPVRQPESPAELMEQAVRLNASRHADSGIQITTEFGDCPTVFSDRHKIVQVLTNLVANAHDAVVDVSGRPRIVTLRTHVVENDFVEFMVEDNGVGMAKGVLSQVLKFGFTTKHDGHGFGLHSCDQAVKALGGELRIHSDGVNRGSSFSLVLPIGADAVAENNDAISAGAKSCTGNSPAAELSVP